MSTSVMRRLDVWACDSDVAALSKKLLRLRCVDVEAAPADASGDVIAHFDASEQIRECERACERISTAMTVLSAFDLKKKSFKNVPLTVNPDEFSASGAAEASEQIVSDVLAAQERLSEIDKEISALGSRTRALTPWEMCDLPLSFAGTDRTRTVLGTVPVSMTDAELEKRLADLPAAFRCVAQSSGGRQMIFLCVDDLTDLLVRRLNSLGFVRADFSFVPEGVCAAEQMKTCSEELAALADEKTRINDFFRASAAKLDELRVLWDLRATELEEARLRERLAKTRHCVILRGWVPKKQEDKVTALLSKCDCAFELSDPVEGDNVPVRLENNAFASCFEWVVGMYSLPAYGTFDPTFIMSVCYVILFSLMMADAGYGLLLVLGGFLAPKLLGLRGNTRKAFNMFGFCGIGCIVTGVLFGGYFGDLPIAIIKAYFPSVTPPQSLALLVDPVLDPMSYLIVGIAFGFAHLVTGQVVKFGIMWREGARLDAIFDIAFFWVLYLGIGLFVLVPAVGKWVLIAAVAAIILTGGRHEKKLIMKPLKGLLALYGLVNLGSDIISYSRILAIALSGTVLAQVFNILSTMTTAPVVGPIVMLVILIVGHVLNLVLSALSGFVHTSRLQYVEFFGKFYVDGGKPYAPMLPSTRFCEPDVD